jgi:DNA polymerase-1
MKVLAGKPGKWGTAYEHFGGGEAGEKACHAIQSLIDYQAVATLLKTFIIPLQGYVDENSRIHCSLNINTETGRLSSSKPNLQNQPALEKDIYRIRDAFRAPPGKKLIVADYGQLELRILANITKCKAMIDDFLSGGDLHSRTAAAMYEHIQKAVDEGQVLMEWNEKIAPPKPLVKDVYGAERRQAKGLTFSIAYGKTAHGLAQDWGVTVDEARESLRRWFDARPEVETWQKETQALARLSEKCWTILGRHRNLPGLSEGRYQGHLMRCAINSPIQGSAADIVMMAMINAHRDQKLRELGWNMILQIHDELIFEGPEESVEQALERVKDCMEHPFRFARTKISLPVSFDVDAKYADSWYEAK